ncbi:MAG: hypothetical protein E3K32_07970 [wastewater metagenome]|nr:hypothetical protein [Candidatus Loosdrechtia aerotolerans]
MRSISRLVREKLGMRFREKFDESVAAKGLPPVHWGQGIWQQILHVYKVRNEFVHVIPGISQTKLMTPLQEAERALVVLRDGIKAVSDLAGLPYPPWVDDDIDRGWQGVYAGLGVTAKTYFVHAELRGKKH